MRSTTFGEPSVTLCTAPHGDADPRDRAGRAGSRDELEPERLEERGQHRHRGLVAVADREEDGAAAGSGRPAARSALREGGGQVGGDAHHLAGRAHLRAQRRIGAGEPLEREHRRLDRDVAAGRLGQVDRSPSAARQAASTRSRPVAFDTNGTVRDARGLASSTYIVLALHGELDVDQAADAERLGDGGRLAADLGLDPLAERHRRDDAGRVAGVDAGLLDVLHDGADHACASPSQIASTSTSIASSTKRSISEPGWTGRASSEASS